jgi:hypothetical protein
VLQYVLAKYQQKYCLKHFVSICTLDSNATSSSVSVAVNDVQSAALEPPAAKRSRTEDSSPEVAEITD